VRLLKAICAKFSSLFASNLANYWGIDYDPSIVLSLTTHKDIKIEFAALSNRVCTFDITKPRNFRALVTISNSSEDQSLSLDLFREWYHRPSPGIQYSQPPGLITFILLIWSLYLLLHSRLPSRSSTSFMEWRIALVV